MTPRRAFRKVRAAICRRRGHPYPTRPVDGIVGHQRVRFAVCSHCEVIVGGDLLVSRKIRRVASRKGVDPVSLLGPDGRLLRATKPGLIVLPGKRP